MTESDVSLPEKFDDTVLNKCKDICDKSAESYKLSCQFRTSLKNSSSVISKFKNHRAGDLTPIDLETAKETFSESREIYTTYTDVIAKGMTYIHQVQAAYPTDLIVLKMYTKYLAILLASKEAQHPVENYLLILAEGPFDFKKVLPVLTEDEEKRGISLSAKSESLTKDYIQTKKRLECRFKKRQLANKLKAGTSTSQIIKELSELIKDDADDIRTRIFLAKLFSNSLLRNNDANTRARMKEGALHHCQLAFSGLDTYLDLQQINNPKKRNLERAGFMKTITSIRLPLIKGH
ncbi:MAG: hypothetical protein GY786_08345 [Proteobacteria bacterium]|nr:hypothetical protein [Pseudomonadota bacterium]